MRLIKFRKNVYSQNGEDGVLGELISRLGLEAQHLKWCVEFGAWDGKHLSNTFNLVENKSWHAVYIEGDPKKYQALLDTAEAFPKIRPLMAMVGGSNGSGTSLDDLLSTTEIPKEYDLLSIDIDSDDLSIWARHVNYSPKIVVIEINSEVPPGILQWHDGEKVFSNSFSAVLEVATRKSYTLVCHTGNLIFVRNDLISRVAIDDLDLMFPERLFLWDWVSNGGTSKLFKILRVVKGIFINSKK